MTGPIQDIIATLGDLLITLRQRYFTIMSSQNDGF